MPSNSEHKKRKLEPLPLEPDTAAALENPPSLPPPPAATPNSSPPNLPPPSSQPNAPASTTDRPPQPPPASSSAAPPATTNSKARPKRARTKAEKKEETENTSRFHCDFCGRDLSFAIRARCAVCPDYDSCLDCFSVGATLAPHKPEHSYRLIEVVHTPIYQIGWSADEEDKLLEGLELYGVGNWEQVAKLIGTKNPVETETHFMKVYLQTPSAPLPDPNRMIPAEKAPLSDKFDDVDPKALRVMHMHQQEDAAGWMEKRKDFVYEWDNEAEEIIGDMEVTEDDSKAEKDLKAQVLEIYDSKLTERKERKDFVLERGLTQFKAYQAVEKKRSKEDKELRDSLRVFMRFVPQSDIEKFIASILEERQLRTKIDLYKEGRAHGATTLEECARINSNSKKKNSLAAVDAQPPNASNALPHRRRRLNGEGSVGDSAVIGPNGVNSVPAPSGVDSKDRKGTILGDVELDMMPGAELLSRTEITLCNALKITPHQYMIIKDVMVRESARNGCLRKKDAKAIVRLDPVKVFKIYDYLLACGWIKSCNSTANAARNAAANAVAPNGTRA